MSKDYNGSEATDLIISIINSDLVSIEDIKLKTRLVEAINALGNDLEEGEYEETPESNDAFLTLQTYFEEIQVELIEDTEVEDVKVIDDEDDEDEDEIFSDEDDEDDDDDSESFLDDDEDEDN